MCGTTKWRLLLKPMKGKCNTLPDLSVRFPLVTQLVIRSNDTTKQQNRASLQLFLSLLRQPKWSSLTSLTLIKMSIITDPTFLPQLCSLISHKFAKQSNSLTQLNLYIQAFGPETGKPRNDEFRVWTNKFDTDWFKELSKLAHLTELKMHCFQLDPTVKVVPLPTIKKLTICDSDLLTHYRASTNSTCFNASHYCRLLSHHFPLVSVLILLSNEKMRVTMVERSIRKWTQVHFKQIDKVVPVLKAVEYRNHSREQDKFRRQYDKLLRN